MPNLTLYLVPPNAPDPSGIDSSGSAKALSDRNGRFTFLAVSPGPYLLRSVFFDRSAGTEPGDPIWAAQALTVGEADINGLTVTLKRGARVSGRVEFAGTPSPPTDRLIILPRPVGAGSWSSSSATVRADGTFATGGDPPGRYELLAGSNQWRVIKVARGGTAFPDFTFVLGSVDVTDLVVTLSKTPSRVSGTITGLQDQRDPEADVIIFPADTNLWRQGFTENRRVQLGHASPAGVFEIGLLSPGEYYIAAVNTRLTLEWRDPHFLERLIPGATRVTLGDGDQKTVALRTLTPRGR
jgi:hypothetical protein